MGQSPGVKETEVWLFRQTAALGRYTTQVLGHPEVIETPLGKAVQFDGVDDALFVPVHPLAGAATWTWEVIFRPDADGAPAQRFFHLSVLDPATGKDIDDRLLFEIRIVNGQWCLDSFAMAGGQSKTLLNCEKVHALGKWYRVSAVYDGKTFSNYVDDELQGGGLCSWFRSGRGIRRWGCGSILRIISRVRCWRRDLRDERWHRRSS